MKSSDQQRGAATALTLGRTKRTWNAPIVIECEVGLTQKAANVAETTDPGYYQQLGPS